MVRFKARLRFIILAGNKDYFAEVTIGKVLSLARSINIFLKHKVTREVELFILNTKWPRRDFRLLKYFENNLIHLFKN